MPQYIYRNPNDADPEEAAPLIAWAEALESQFLDDLGRFTHSVYRRYKNTGFITKKQLSSMINLKRVVDETGRRPVRCRRCQGWLKTKRNIAAGIGPKCEELEEADEEYHGYPGDVRG